MGTIKVKTSEMGSHRFMRLQASMDASPEHTLGVLALFWAQAEAKGFERAERHHLENCLRADHAPSGMEAFRCLLDAGYVELEDEGECYSIPDMRGIVERKAKRMAISQAANRAKADKRKEPIKKARKPKAEKPEVITTEAWQAYHDAYSARFREPPLSDATNRSLMKRFVQRVGIEDAPHVLRFYLQHTKKIYIDRMFPLNLALSDAGALHTQWKRGAIMDDSKVRQFTQALSYEQRQAEIRAGRF